MIYCRRKNIISNCVYYVLKLNQSKNMLVRQMKLMIEKWVSPVSRNTTIQSIVLLSGEI